MQEVRKIKRNTLRVGVVHAIPEPSLYDDESDGDHFAKLSYCFHCKEKRTTLYLLPHKKKMMRVCTNPACFLECDIQTLKTWVKE